MDDEEEDNGTDYYIVKMYAPHVGKPIRVVKKGLTLKEARAFCAKEESGLRYNNGQFFYGYDHKPRKRRSS